MLKTRVVPCLLVQQSRLVKTVAFRDPRYVGDPINAVRIFNEKEVDELVVLDIAATVEQQPPNLRLISELASECFMPLAYGGGIKSLEHIQSRRDPNEIPANLAYIQPPLDYAPKASPDEKGMLNEEFGLERRPAKEQGSKSG